MRLRCEMERGLTCLAPFSFSSHRSLFAPRGMVDIAVDNICSQLFRLVTIEVLMGKSLTGSGSGRYLWALFVSCFDVALRTAG
jgi:hypothetical protein